ncbi:hypothetical protein GCM10010519_51140 [Streptomyces lactacystinicus]
MCSVGVCGGNRPSELVPADFLLHERLAEAGEGRAVTVEAYRVVASLVIEESHRYRKSHGPESRNDL